METLQEFGKRLGFIRTTHRFKDGIDQKVRLFKHDQREIIIDYVRNRPNNKTIDEMLEPIGISPVVYHNWVRKMRGKTKETLKIKQMEYKIVSGGSVHELNRKILELVSLGWKPVGGHQVVVVHVQNQYSGSQHTRTHNELEYSQSMMKE